MDFFIYLSDYSITGFCFSSSVPYFSRFVLWSSLETFTSVGMILRSFSSPSFSSTLHFQLFARLVCVCVCVPPTSPRWQVPKLIYSSSSRLSPNLFCLLSFQSQPVASPPFSYLFIFNYSSCVASCCSI